MKKIIVFDDCKQILKLILKFFRNKNFDVTIVDNFKDFHFYINATTYDLCLIDERLGDGLSGVDIIKQLKNKHSLNIPFIVMTGQQDIKIFDRGSKVGINSFISKPFDLVDLEERVSRCINENEIISKKNKMIQKMDSEVKSGEALLEKILSDKSYCTGAYCFNWEGKNSFGLGGDFVFHEELDHSNLLFCLGDVSGHGLRASYIVNNFLNNLKRVLTSSKDFKLDLIINETIKSMSLDDDYICLIIGLLNKSTGNIQILNLGMKDPLIYNRRLNTLVPFTSSGDIPIGWCDNSYPLSSFDSFFIQNDETIILCTDGFYEKPYSNEIVSNCEILNLISPGEFNEFTPFMAHKIFKKVHSENFDHHDDSTILTLCRMGDFQSRHSYNLDIAKFSRICEEVSNHVMEMTHSYNICAKVELILSEFISNILKFSTFKNDDNLIDIFLDFSRSLKLYVVIPKPQNYFKPKYERVYLPHSESEGGYGLSIIKSLCSNVKEEYIGDKYVSIFSL